MKKLLLLILLSLPGFSAHAAYQVEIIIFEHLFHDAEGEVSQIGLRIPDLDNAVQLSDAGDDSFGLLPTSMYKLGGVYSELRASKEYRPILHLAWRQPQLPQSKARYVHVRKTDGAPQQEGFGDAYVKLDGVVRIRSAQFLHADIDLFYFLDAVSESFINASAGSEEANQIAATFAELKETRRMKLNELHYFDHPVFGLLMRVSRLSAE